MCCIIPFSRCACLPARQVEMGRGGGRRGGCRDCVFVPLMAQRLPPLPQPASRLSPHSPITPKPSYFSEPATFATLFWLQKIFKIYLPRWLARANSKQSCTHFGWINYFVEPNISCVDGSTRRESRSCLWILLAHFDARSTFNKVNEWPINDMQYWLV